MDLGLKGKVAIVTGGASNIGRAISMTLGKEGAIVIITDIDERQMKEVVQAIESSGGRAVAVRTDITKYDQVQTMIKGVLDRFGKIDILVNNVGWDSLMRFVDTTPELWQKIIDINYQGMMNCCHLVLPHMIERKTGAVISVASDAGRMGEYLEGVYGGCKAARISLSKTIAREVGRYGIRLNVVCPGLTPATSPEEVGEYGSFGRGFSPMDPERVEKASKLYPLRRLGKAQDTANAV
ncbi:MAG: SDR family oxidoreductase, partial [Deltaproteobacteria bacterium]|nr:SDR family oxidoreductase [Deltaproteobacteria bacterium]